MAILHARGLTKTIDTGTHRVEILRGLDLEVPAGQFVAIMGASGSGKSTLLGLLAGLFLLSTAFGYQLDKYELAYAANGVATGVGFADANARFFAYDLLTVVSGLAAAFLVGGAFTRWLWPLGATMVVWLLASFFVGTLYPLALETVTGDKISVGPPYFNLTFGPIILPLLLA